MLLTKNCPDRTGDWASLLALSHNLHIAPVIIPGLWLADDHNTGLWLAVDYRWPGLIFHLPADGLRHRNKYIASRQSPGEAQIW